jgi:tetratricopeptide (TPR) repeat protein
MNLYRSFACLCILLLMALPAIAVGADNELNSAGALYSKSVDLANEGKYTDALQAADQALALNVSSLVPAIQSNRAGILVMLKRNTEAVAAADAALAVEGNLTTVHSIAWYNKGNALRALGRTTDAKEAYARAYALDNTLAPPDLSRDVPSATTKPQVTGQLGVTEPSVVTMESMTTTPLPPATTPRSPLPFFAVAAALGIVALMSARSGKPPE